MRIHQDIAAPRLAFLSPRDAQSQTSGTHYHMAKALSRYVGEVTIYSPLGSRTFWNRANDRLRRALRLPRKRFDSHGEILRQFKDDLEKGKEFDFIFAPNLSGLVPALAEYGPVIFVSDSTPRRMFDFYPSYTNLDAAKREAYDRTEKQALDAAALVLYSSHWAAQSAIEDYGVPVEKVKVLYQGPSLELDGVTPPPKEPRPDGAPLKVLFLCNNWERKGGDVALEIADILRDKGYAGRIEITLCGQQPKSRAYRNHPILTSRPYLNKDTPDGLSTLLELYRTHDVMLLPTRADCTPRALVEAGWFGLPIVASAVGAIPEYFTHFTHGSLLHPSSEIREYADALIALYRDSDLLLCMSRNIHDLTKEHHNWQAWALATSNECLT